MLNPRSFPSRARRGFTIIETVVVMIIIGLMLIIIVPHYFAGRKIKKAQRVKADLISLNSAIEHYALDNGKAGGFQPAFGDLRKYLDPKTDIFTHNGKDILGDSYGPFVVGNLPSVPPKTANKLSSVADPDFWSPFR